MRRWHDALLWQVRQVASISAHQRRGDAFVHHKQQFDTERESVCQLDTPAETVSERSSLISVNTIYAGDIYPQHTQVQQHITSASGLL